MRYCPTDKARVETEKEFSWPWALFWFIFGAGWGVLIYLIYYAFKSETKCVRCGSETLSSPPPGYVENPNTTAEYIPEGVAQQQQELHQPNQGQISAAASPQRLGTDGGPKGSLPAGEEWEDVSPMTYTTCPNCHKQFSIQKQRPLDVTCPACGTSGRLPADEEEQPEIFAETSSGPEMVDVSSNDDPEPLTELPGLGGSTNWEREQLEEVGIETTGELAASSPQRIAQDTDISSSRAEALIERAIQERRNA